MFGFLNIHKSAGVTSRDAVNAVQRLLPRGTKVGHAGTLDPLATGVLVLCVGPATRLVPYVQDQKKTYRAGFRLGCRSNTDDSTGEVVESSGFAVPSSESIRSALTRFQGTILQTPPQFSALHVNGKRAYDLARAGVPVDLAPREVTISRIELLQMDGRDLQVEIDCSSGTYIRSIARDLGDALGTGGLMTSLIRTAIGLFTLDHALTVESLDRTSLPTRLISPPLALELPRLPVDGNSVSLIRQGKTVDAAGLPAGSEVMACSEAGDLIAIGEITPASRFQPRMVFAGSGH